MQKASLFSLFQRRPAKTKPEKKQKDLKSKQETQKILKLQEQNSQSNSDMENDLNIVAITFNAMRNIQSQLSGGDHYQCVKCKAILNKYSKIIKQEGLKENQNYWQCQFCNHGNVIHIEQEQIPLKDQVYYMLESNQKMHQTNQQEQTMIFCIDLSGSMNTTTEVNGKIDLKYGLSQEEITMLKQFMQPGDQAQFNFLPGKHNKNKTFISRKQCILSAIESQLNILKKQHPEKKIGFITFNNQVALFGDAKCQSINLVGDKLNDTPKIRQALIDFRLTQSIGEVYDYLIKSLSKAQAKGQTSLGPALVAAIEVAAKGKPGSSVILCTDGLANVGVGSLEGALHAKFYQDLGLYAKQRQVTVNIITIKGQGCKMQIIGKLAQQTNGNMKVVSPQKLSDDFANVLKDEVVGLNIEAKIMMHKCLEFRNENKQQMNQDKSILFKQLPNATINTRLSFEYKLKNDEELEKMMIDIDKLDTVPFQVQITFTSPKGGKFMRVVSSQSKTTINKEQIKKEANLGVVHQRVTSQTAALFMKGDQKHSNKYNNRWKDYLEKNFQQQQHMQKQTKFMEKNTRLNKAIKNKHMKKEKQQKLIPEIMEEEDRASLVDSDEDQMEIMDNFRQRQQYSLQKKPKHKK